MAANPRAGTDAGIRTLVELQAEVCYMNVDRTLATWTRTALSLIVFGTVVDRFGLVMTRAQPPHVGTLFAQNPASSAGGAFLVALGVCIALAAAIRHEAYRRSWIRTYGHPGFHGPWLALALAALTVVAGSALFAILLAFRQ